MRHRLLELVNNRAEEHVLRKMFKDFDLNASGHITIDELASMCAKLKIAVDRKYLYGVFKIIDVNHSGAIEFDEFMHFIANDPYSS